MKRLAGMIWVVLAFVMLSSDASALDREAFTFTRYDLKVEVEPAKGTLAASGTIQLRNDSAAPQANLVLQITSTLQWTAIAEGDTPLPFLAQNYTSDIDHTGELSEAIVTLPKPLPPKASITLRVAYRGTVPGSAGRLTRIGAPAEAANASEWDKISDAGAAVRGIGYVTWFPVALNSVSLSEGNTVLNGLAAWKARQEGTVLQVALEAPRPPAAAAPLSIRWNTTRTSLCAAAPTAVCASASFQGFGQVPTFAIGSYELLDRPQVDVAFRPEHTSLARDYAVAVERSVPLVTEWFGKAGKVHVIELDDPNATPFDSGPFVFTPLRPLNRAALDAAMIHQAVHAAFDSKRLWISEGVAHFMQALVRERQAGRRAALEYLSQIGQPLVVAERAATKPAATGGESTPPGALAQSLVTSTDPLYFRGKAAYVWWMLRDMVSEEVLQAAFRGYRAEEDAQPAYMQNLLERTSPGSPPRNLEWFFDDWVYRSRGLPDFRIESAYPRKTLNGTYVVTVTVENLGKAGAEVPVLVAAAGGERSARVLVQAGAKAVARVQIPEAPTRVTVNDGSVPELDTSNNSFEIKAPQP